MNRLHDNNTIPHRIYRTEYDVRSVMDLFTCLYSCYKWAGVIQRADMCIHRGAYRSLYLIHTLTHSIRNII